MENINGKAVNLQKFQNLLIRVADIVNIDGPLLTLYLHPNRQLYLFDWVDRDNQYNRWLIYPSTTQLLNRFIHKEISHFDLLTLEESFVLTIDIDSKLNWQNTQQLTKKALPTSYLPDKNIYFNEDFCPNFSRLNAFLNPIKKRDLELALA